MTTRRNRTVRDINLQAVLACVVSAPAPLSRSAISTITGLTKATVSSLVEHLIEASLVAELAPTKQRSSGRPAVPLVLAEGTMGGLGLHIDADQLGAVVVDLTGTTIMCNIVPGNFRQSDPLATAARLADVARPVLQAAADSNLPLLGAALSVPGPIQLRTGRVMRAPNLHWPQTSLLDLLGSSSAFTDLSLTIGNESDYGAEAEAWHRRHRDEGHRSRHNSFIYAHGSVGVGGALVLDGRVYRGRNGWSMEIGHTCVAADGPSCNCGSRGCLERYAGKDAILDAAGMSPDEPLSTLAAAAAAGDPQATGALSAAGSALGIALANAVNLLDVTEIVLAGTFAPLWEGLRNQVEAELSTRSFSSSWVKPIVHTTLAGPQPALVGAALSVIANALRSPARLLRTPLSIPQT